MHKTIIILLLILLNTGCRSGVNIKTSMWEIIQTTSDSRFFKVGMVVDFSGNTIRFKENDLSNKYPFIISDKRMVIETGYLKWLFEVEHTDSTIILRELYTKEPVIITMKKINNTKISYYEKPLHIHYHPIGFNHNGKSSGFGTGVPSTESTLQRHRRR